MQETQEYRAGLGGYQLVSGNSGRPIEPCAYALACELVAILETEEKTDGSVSTFEIYRRAGVRP
jgi:hypothetical protein